MTYEEAVEAAQRLAEAWNAFGIKICEFADMLINAINSCFTLPQKEVKVETRRQRVPPRRPPYKIFTGYNYIPRAIRNRPYQRRSY